MTIPEAVQLVIAGGRASAEGGDIFVLDMGEPVKIIDLARHMIELSGIEPGDDIAIEVVGCGPARSSTRSSSTWTRRSGPPATARSCAPPGPRSTRERLRHSMDELGRLIADGRPGPVASGTVGRPAGRRQGRGRRRRRPSGTSLNHQQGASMSVITHNEVVRDPPGRGPARRRMGAALACRAPLSRARWLVRLRRPRRRRRVPRVLVRVRGAPLQQPLGCRTGLWPARTVAGSTA